MSEQLEDPVYTLMVDEETGDLKPKVDKVMKNKRDQVDNIL